MNLVVKVIPNDYFQACAYVFNLGETQFNELIKIKQSFNLFKGDFNLLEELSFNSFLNGFFIDNIDFIDENTYSDYFQSHNLYEKSDERLQYELVKINEEGISVLASCKYSGNKIETATIPWEFLGIN